MKLKIPSLLLLCFISFFAAAKNQSSGIHAIHQAWSTLSFIENKGQIENSKIDFKLDGKGIQVFIENGALHYQWKRNIKINEDSGIVEVYRMDVKLLGSNPHAESVAEEKQEYYERYYTSMLNGVVAQSYNRVVYKNVYPGIDWVLYTKDGQLEYDFIVHQGGEASNIQIRYEGADLELKDGQLTANTPFGNITERKPYSYVAENKLQVNTSFRLKDNVLSFETGKYNGTLVIDPVVVWATYYGGEKDEEFVSVASDSNDNIFAFGVTTTVGSLATIGAFIDTLDINGTYREILVKFSATGQRLWATHYHPHWQSGIWSMHPLLYIKINQGFNRVICDYRGNILIVGQQEGNTKSPTNLFEYYIAKFNTDGTRLWENIFGKGALHDYIRAITSDKNGNIYIGGHTSSMTGIGTLGLGVFQPIPVDYNAPYIDMGFLTKFDSAGVRRWGSYYNTSTAVMAISCDDTGNIYAAGNTLTRTRMYTPGAYDSTYSGNEGNYNSDGFLVKFNTNGARLWGTYFGGDQPDSITAICYDNNGNIYIAGSTLSDTEIATQGSFKDTLSRDSSYADAFIAKFSAISGVLKWGTYLGGEKYDLVHSIALGKKGNLYLAGQTASTSAIATADGLKGSLSGNMDAFLAIFDTTGNRLYGTYYGGPGNDAAYAITTTETAALAIVGVTDSASDVATAGSFKEHVSGPTDGFLMKFVYDTMSLARPYPDGAFCPGDSLSINFNTSFSFNAGNVFTAELSDSSGAFTAPVNIGSITSLRGNIIYCKLPQHIPVGKWYRLRVRASNPAYVSDPIHLYEVKQAPQKPIITTNTPMCEGWNLEFAASDNLLGTKFSWTGPNGFKSHLQKFTGKIATPEDSGFYYVTATYNGCTDRDTHLVKVYHKQTILNPSNDGPKCQGSHIALSATQGREGGIVYTWEGPNNYRNNGRDNVVLQNINLNMAGDYIVHTNIESCGYDTTNVVVKANPVITASSNSPVDSGAIIQLIAVGDTTNQYEWVGPNGFMIFQQNPVIPNASLRSAGMYMLTAIKDSCVSAASTIVEVKTLPATTFSITPNPSYGTLQLKGTVLNDQVLQVVITNRNGQIVFQQNYTSVNLRVNETLDLGALSSGMYMLRLRMDDEIYTHEFVLLK